MQSVMNLKIKFRESFRPFAPIVLREYVDRCFQMRPYEDSPYMLLVAPVREEIRIPPRAGRGSRSFGIERLRMPLDDPRRDARRLLGPGSDRRCRARIRCSSSC